MIDLAIAKVFSGLKVCGKRVFSGFLAFLLILGLTLSALSNSVVFAASGTQQNFLDFYGSSDSSILEMKNLTTQDYYTMYTFWSNWFQPGVTTLGGLMDGNDSSVSAFEKAFNKESDPSLRAVLQALATDTYNGLQSGICTLYMKGSHLTGSALIEELGTIAQFSDSGAVSSFSGAEIKYGSASGNLAFDLDANVTRAMLQTVFAYNPDLFLSSSGIKSLSALYIDAVGNVWGATSAGTAGYDWSESRNKGANSIKDAGQVYLIVPACLNAAAFSPKVTNVADLRMPLMNRFVLSSLVRKDELTDMDNGCYFSEKYVPIFAALSQVADTRRNSVLSVLGVNSISPYTLNTGAITSDVWSGAMSDLADFAFNPSSFVLESTGKIGGSASIATYSYIVFGIDLHTITGTGINAQDGSNSVLDLSTGFGSIFNPNWGDITFDVFSDVETLKKYLVYFGTPTMFPLTNVSMNFFRYGTNTDTEDGLLAELCSKLVSAEGVGSASGLGSPSVSDISEGLTSVQATQLGLSGMSLFLNDLAYTVNTSDSSTYYSTAPDNMVDSFLVMALQSELSSFLYNVDDSADLRDGIGLDAGYPLTNLLYRHKLPSGRSVSEITFEVRDGMSYGTYLMSDYLDWASTFENLTFTASSKTQVLAMTCGKTSNIIRPDVLDDVVYVDSSSTYASKFYFNILGCYDEGASILYAGSTSTKWITPPGSTTAVLTDDPDYMALGLLLGGKDTLIHDQLHIHKGSGENGPKSCKVPIIPTHAGGSIKGFEELTNYIVALYGYSLFFPSDCIVSNPAIVGTTGGLFSDSIGSADSITLFGSGSSNSSGIPMRTLGGNFLAGMYLSYIVDMMGIGSITDTSVSFGSFGSVFLPRYAISAGGGSMTAAGLAGASGSGDITGIDGAGSLTGKQKQETLLERFYELTNPTDSTYRDNLLRSIFNGFILMIHRTLTGTLAGTVNSVTLGSTSTYASITGFTYTPTLEELPFAAIFLDNYVTIYIFAMIFMLFVLVLLVVTNNRSLRDGILVLCVVSCALLLPYIWVSNVVNVGNSVVNEIYSDRFDFWAMTEHASSVSKLSVMNFVDSKDQWLLEASATQDSTLVGNPGVKIKWMSPKKVDLFQSIYSDASLSKSFVTNMEIFKWLFSSTIYDSEFTEAGAHDAYVYRSYNNIALEAGAYYQWAEELDAVLTSRSNVSYVPETSLSLVSGGTPSGIQYSVPDVWARSLDKLTYIQRSSYGAGIGRLDRSFFASGVTAGSPTTYAADRLVEFDQVAQSTQSGGASASADMIGLWGACSTTVSDVIGTGDFTNTITPGIVSNLPSGIGADDFSGKSVDDVARAIFLKNTESPFYYFYSVLKMRYGDVGFKQSLLNQDLFKYHAGMQTGTSDQADVDLKEKYSLNGAVRDFLDMEGLFEYVIPYLADANEYVTGWQAVNGSEVVTYNFEYEVDASGDAVSVSTDSDYQEAVRRKNAVNRVWNMYSSWIDSLYQLDVANEYIRVAGNKVRVADSLSPTSYLTAGRAMIFSEADMLVRGYTYADLSDVERRIQAVLDKTYVDCMYLVNYFDLDNEVLLCAAAMYATFNFNSEFSDNDFLGDSVNLYPQCFELRNFNYDAYMRLALLNATGEAIFDEDDLYNRVLSKTSLFTGIFLIICDLLACIVIPALKFAILLLLLFLGIVVCISCVLNPPDTLLKAIWQAVILPAVLFLIANVGFAWLMSFVVGEGLTAYVGSKTAVAATNDPTITMLIMALLSILYCVALVAIFLNVWKGMKSYGLGSIFATAGLITTAVTYGTKRLANFSGRIISGTSSVVSGTVGAAYAAASAEKGSRFDEAVVGLRGGIGSVLRQRAEDRRQRRNLNAAEADNVPDSGDTKAVTQNLDTLASQAGDGNGVAPELKDKVASQSRGQENPVARVLDSGDEHVSNAMDTSGSSTSLSPTPVSNAVETAGAGPVGQRGEPTVDELHDGYAYGDRPVTNVGSAYAAMQGSFDIHDNIVNQTFNVVKPNHGVGEDSAQVGTDDIDALASTPAQGVLGGSGSAPGLPEAAVSMADDAKRKSEAKSKSSGSNILVDTDDDDDDGVIDVPFRDVKGADSKDDD